MNNLYKIETNDFGRDEYDSFIFCAENESEAQSFLDKYDEYILGDFSKSNFIKIGIAEDNLEKGVVIESYNAG